MYLTSFSGLDLIPLLVVFIAYLVRGICGFGSGLIAIPVLSLVLPLHVAVPVVVILDFLASAAQGGANRKQVQVSEITALLPFAVLGVVAGTTLFHVLDTAVLKQSLGAFLLVYAAYSLWAPEIRSVSRLWAVPVAFSGGMVGTLFGTGGPFYVSYLKARGLDKGALRATFAVVFLLDASLRIGGYLSTGLITPDTLRWLALGMPAMIVGMYLGGRVHTGISARTFTRAISILLVGSGLALMI